MIHQRNENMAPDTDFEPGDLRFMVPDNEGRLLDVRRTPVRITEVRVPTGEFELEVMDFEDKGVRWLLPFEDVSRFQFAKGSAELSKVGNLKSAIDRLNQPLKIPAANKPVDVQSQRAEARPLVDGNALDLSSRQGSDAAAQALRRYMEVRGLYDLEEAFSTQFVSNPYSGELVKGHRIVMADLGLVAFDGKAVRNPNLFAGAWSKERRADHILSRLAFVRELFEAAGHPTVVLWRGVCAAGPLEQARNKTFTSTSFLKEVAQSLTQSDDVTRTLALYRQRVPVTRLFMTYVETEAMNKQFLEAEGILMFDPHNHSF